MRARLADRDRVDDFFLASFSWALHPSLGGLKLEKILLSSSNPSFLKAHHGNLSFSFSLLFGWELEEGCPGFQAQAGGNGALTPGREGRGWMAL